MQTFMPYPSMIESAGCLDRMRLGKQRVEAKQLLLALGVPVGEHAPRQSSWGNHPAARMWRGHELSLAHYGATICREWINRGYKDSLLPQFKAAYAWLADRNTGLAYPSWIGSAEFHAAHRSNLLRKLPSWYSQFGWREPADMPYVWPA